MGQLSWVKDPYLRNECCVCSASWWLDEVGDGLLAHHFLIFGPAAYVSGFPVASGPAAQEHAVPVSSSWQKGSKSKG